MKMKNILLVVLLVVLNIVCIQVFAINRSQIATNLQPLNQEDATNPWGIVYPDTSVAAPNYHTCCFWDMNDYGQWVYHCVRVRGGLSCGEFHPALI